MVQSILFVSHTWRRDRPYFDPSVRYRCFNPAAALRRRGVRAWVTSQAAFEDEDLGPFDAYVFHRPVLTPGLLRRIEARQASPRVADYDDLVFDVTVAAETSAVRNRGEPVWDVRRQVAAFHGALQLFDRVTASTAPLAAAVRRLRPEARVAVAPNRPDRGYLALAEALWPERGGPRASVGYFAGTQSHDEDLRSVWRPLTQFCAAHDVELVLVGPVAAPDKGGARGLRLRQAPLVGFLDLPRALTSCDFVIAPLVPGAFAACKSGIKLMEAGAAGVPVVATPVPDMALLGSALLYGAPEPGDWPAALAACWARDRAGDVPAARAMARTLGDDGGVEPVLGLLDG